MSKHSKILDSWKDKIIVGGIRIPVYYVTKSSKYGIFTCSVKPCPQDYPNINDWDGYRFAERKCDIEIAHTKAKVLKERARGILNVHKTLHTKYKATKQYELGIVLGDIYYQYELAQEEYEKAYAQYKYMKDSFPDYTSRMIERRKQLNKKLEEKRAAELQD
jgi:hypothetical protein